MFHTRAVVELLLLLDVCVCKSSLVSCDGQAGWLELRVTLFNRSASWNRISCESPLVMGFIAISPRDARHGDCGDMGCPSSE